MSRKKIIKVHFQKNFDEGSEDENPFAFGKSTKKEYWRRFLERVGRLKFVVKNNLSAQILYQSPT